MKYKLGYPFYGQNVGILVFSTSTPRLSGDAGNNDSFKYPVCYEIVSGGFKDLVEGSDEIRSNLCEAILRLQNKGIKAIVGDCGMMSLYQKEMGALTDIPVIASALSQIPSIWNILGRRGKIGVITGHSEFLSSKHLEASGCLNIPVIIQGMEDEQHFREIVIEGGHHLDDMKMKYDVLTAVSKLLEKSNEIRAIVFECSNIPTYSKAVNEKFGIPIFDIISAANWLEYSVNPPSYI